VYYAIGGRHKEIDFSLRSNEVEALDSYWPFAQEEEDDFINVGGENTEIGALLDDEIVKITFKKDSSVSTFRPSPVWVHTIFSVGNEV
jgi:hypothetical protein